MKVLIANARMCAALTTVAVTLAAFGWLAVTYPLVALVWFLSAVLFVAAMFSETR